ncbi:hypothetical protein [Diaphorobacter sp. J5-51]|uniref:hypothetical protein n=1 Tax=Diaphorobacter sp. J5-51 TaxID=680496 RepID=UPI000643DBFE|nr:hypothetical protein [Diaphorobacter sp. J5-51]KLR57428.1 hypothetical protein OX89_12465 [Diaphorobacter sp. J5-51]
MQNQIIFLALALVVAWLLFGKAYNIGYGISRRFNGFLNRIAFERNLRKAQEMGIEQEYRDAFLDYGGFHEFAWQRPGLAWYAFRIAKATATNKT